MGHEEGKKGVWVEESGVESDLNVSLIHDERK